ncbi:SUMO-activating enzyme subunit 1 [Trachymyrmex zeteki]|uniref:SUMO-activating enzyme subunit 1 n=1 Tax=Mycetomoellerius zeteki TaxID=64791 RepID=A0A151WF97_9HYME|nr:PREDICTED: SUMO-activating enzyme subunit 1 [Trachymyrmex zeteki]KYQ46491.1 SUMO-activating enzyme subunit 1 [Trachymyrmex zeteki]
MLDHKQTEELTDHEAELYDRQLRLWGLDSQKRLRAAKILLIGLDGFGAEIAKNIILAGVKSVTFLDHRNMTELDRCSQFFIPKEDIGKNKAEASLPRAQNLNPMVNVNADSDKVDDKPDEYFGQFDVVCAMHCTITQLKRINRACRNQKVKFFAGDVWGGLGYVFIDLQEHEYVEDVSKSKKVMIPEGGEPVGKEKIETITVSEKRTETFVPFEFILNVPKTSLIREEEIYYMMLILLNYREKYDEDPLPNERGCENLKNEASAIIKKYELGDKINNLVEGDLYGQLSPVCSVVGGIVAQEIIKAASQKHAPLNNLFTFNPDSSCGVILKLGY